MRLKNVKNLFKIARLKKLRSDFKNPVFALLACSGLFKVTFNLTTSSNSKLRTNRDDIPLWEEYFSGQNAKIEFEQDLFKVIPNNEAHPEYTIQGANHCFTHLPVRWNKTNHPLIKRLENSERKIYSQHGEDGIIESLLELMPEKRNFIVEFGAYDGVCMSNSRYWIKQKGWSAFLIEADDRFYKRLHKLYSKQPGVTIKKSFVTEKNINEIFKQAHVPVDFDVLSIDIDSIDYQVWEALTEYKPKIVLIEYNALLPPDQEYVMPADKINEPLVAAEAGASILSLYKLGKQKGYHLAYADLSGTNLFFIHESCLDYIDCATITPEVVYQPPQFGVLAGGSAPNGRGY